MNIKQLFLLCILIVPCSHGMEMYNDEGEVDPLTYGLDQTASWIHERNPIERELNYHWFKKTVRERISKGADINGVSPDGKYTPLSLAARRGDIRQCKIFLQLGANINNGASMYTPLVAALMGPREGREKMLRFLIARGSDINQVGNDILGLLTPLKMAIMGLRSDSDVYLNFLLEAGADPLLRDSEGRNALMFAASSGHNPYWPVNNIIRCLVQRKYACRPQQIALLCAVNRLRVSGSWHEKCLGSTLYLNRSRILQYLDTQPSLADALLLCDINNKTAYDSATNYQGFSSMSLVNLLEPANARKNELGILKEIRETAERRRFGRESQFCVMQ